MRRVLQSGCWLLVLLAVGCGSKLNEERAVSVAAGEERSLTIDPSTRDQKVRVQVQSPGAPVNVYCFLAKDQSEAEKAIGLRKASDKLLASQEKKEEAELEIAVPANNAAVVLLTSASGKTAAVKVKLSNR